MTKIQFIDNGNNKPIESQTQGSLNPSSQEADTTRVVRMAVPSDKEDSKLKEPFPDEFVPVERGVYYRRASGFYYIRFKDPYNRWKWLKAGASKESAQKLFAKTTSLVVEKKYFDVKPDFKTTWDEIAEDYLAYSEINKRSYQKDIDINKHLGKFFSGKALAEISPGFIEQYKAKRLKSKERTAKPSTLNRELGFIRAAFYLGIKNKKASVNPMSDVEFMEEHNERNRFATQDEIKRLLANAPRNLYPVIVTAINTGMRKGEILELEWKDVSFEQKTITVKNSKNGKKRVVPINAQLENILRECYNRKPQAKFVFGSKKGERYQQISTLFKNLTVKSGIEDFKFHDLRHTFASYMIMSGADPVTVMQILGHSSLRMTERYAHLSQEHKLAAVEKLGEKLSGCMAQVMQCDEAPNKRI